MQDSTNLTFSDLGFFDERDVSRLTKRALSTVRKDRLRGNGPPWCRIQRSIRYPAIDFERWMASLPRRAGRQAEEAR